MDQTPVSILLVEDNTTFVTVVRRMIESCPEQQRFTLEVAATLTDGIDRLEEKPIDVVLLDLNLPDSTGPDTVHGIAAVNPGVPIVVLTGTTSEETAIGAMREGAQDYLTKGQLTAEGLFRSIRYAVERKRISEQCRKVSEEWQATFDSIRDWVLIIDGDCRIVKANRSFAETFDMVSDRIVGRHCREFFDEEDNPCDDCPHKDAMESGELRTREIFNHRLWIHQEINAAPLLNNRGEPTGSTLVVKDNTSNKRVEERVRENESFVRGLMENTPLGVIYLDREGTVVYENPASRAIIDGSDDHKKRKIKIIGSNIFDIPGIKNDPGIQEKIRTILSGKPVSNFIVDYLSTSGHASKLSASGSPRFAADGRQLGAVIVYYDVTESKKLEEQLMRASNEWRTTFDSISDLVSMHDDTFGFIKVNKALAEAFGKQPGDVIGKKCHTLFNGRKTPCRGCPYPRMKATGEPAASEIVSKPLGKSFMVSVSPIFDKSGQIVGAAHIAADITEKKAADAERERLIVDLRDALAKVKTLSGLLPICASCKRIRDDKGNWSPIEVYIHDRSEAQFSHGICPECAKRLYPKYFET